MKSKIEIDAEQVHICVPIVRYALALLARLYGGEIPENLVWRTGPQQDIMIKEMSQEVGWTPGNKDHVRTLGGISLQVELSRPKDVIFLESEDKTRVYLEVKNLGLHPRLEGNKIQRISEFAESVETLAAKCNCEIRSEQGQNMFPNYDRFGYLSEWSSMYVRPKHV